VLIVTLSNCFSYIVNNKLMEAPKARTVVKYWNTWPWVCKRKSNFCQWLNMLIGQNATFSSEIIEIIQPFRLWQLNYAS